ncbi:MAG: hypothetical protein R3F59_17485 [Myxococcota bacterium]
MAAASAPAAAATRRSSPTAAPSEAVAPAVAARQLHDGVAGAAIERDLRLVGGGGEVVGHPVDDPARGGGRRLLEPHRDEQAREAGVAQPQLGPLGVAALADHAQLAGAERRAQHLRDVVVGPGRAPGVEQGQQRADEPRRLGGDDLGDDVEHLALPVAEEPVARDQPVGVDEHGRAPAQARRRVVGADAAGELVEHGALAHAARAEQHHRAAAAGEQVEQALHVGFALVGAGQAAVARELVQRLGHAVEGGGGRRLLAVGPDERVLLGLGLGLRQHVAAHAVRPGEPLDRGGAGLDLQHGEGLLALAAQPEPRHRGAGGHELARERQRGGLGVVVGPDPQARVEARQPQLAPVAARRDHQREGGARARQLAVVAAGAEQDERVGELDLAHLADRGGGEALEEPRVRPLDAVGHREVQLLDERPGLWAPQGHARLAQHGDGDGAVGVGAGQRRAGSGGRGGHGGVAARGTCPVAAWRRAPPRAGVASRITAPSDPGSARHRSASATG